MLDVQRQQLQLVRPARSELNAVHKAAIVPELLVQRVVIYSTPCMRAASSGTSSRVLSFCQVILRTKRAAKSPAP